MKTKKAKNSKKTKTDTKSPTIFADGQITEEKEKLQSLEDILNPNMGHNPFKTTKEEEFEKNVADMSVPEMQSLAVELGVFPSGNKTTLKNKLKKEFKKKFLQGKGNVIQSTSPVLDVDQMTEEQKKLFGL